MKQKKLFETMMQWIFTLFGLISLAFVCLITIYLVVSGIPAILKIGLVEFLFSSKWAPTASDARYGILPFILTSVYGTCGAIVIGVPLGIFTSVYIAKFANQKVRALTETLIQILASIPSVVFGLVGMYLIVPFVAKIFSLSDGASLFCAIIVLTIMILPSIIKVSLTSLDAVSKDYEQASFALGATDVETYFKVSVLASRSGILTAMILGVGRAIGEAMAVMMVSGNATNMPGLFESVRFLTTAVSSEMAYASGLQRQALFSIALVLYVFILLINAILHKTMKAGQHEH